MPTHIHTVSAVGGLPQCHRERDTQRDIEKQTHTDRHT